MENAITKNKTELDRLEEIIQQNIGAFYEVGRALMAIRDDELYKIKNGGAYQTFEAYCKDVWDFNSSRARQLMAATETIDNIKSVTNCNTPTNEGQTRPLVRLDLEQQVEAWQKAVDTAPDGKVTAAHVQKVVRDMEPPKPYILKPRQPQIPEHAIYFATIAISQLERITDDDPTKEKALNMVIDWIKKHRNGGHK